MGKAPGLPARNARGSAKRLAVRAGGRRTGQLCDSPAARRTKKRRVAFSPSLVRTREREWRVGAKEKREAAAK